MYMLGMGTRLSQDLYPQTEEYGEVVHPCLPPTTEGQSGQHPTGLSKCCFCCWDAAATGGEDVQTTIARPSEVGVYVHVCRLV